MNSTEIIMAVLVLVGIAIFLGLVLGFAAVRFKVEGDPITDQIDAILPQTQCGQCTYAGCRPYAEAIAKGDVGINHCPPGGESTILALADLLDVEPEPLDESLDVASIIPTVAVIIEADCIGCTLCIQACPVDAIVGAAKQMHTVIEAECTGCDLCLPPCPVDCIVMIPIKETPSTWKHPQPSQALRTLQTIAVTVETKKVGNK